ncbi:hypothetical protein RchiOBHm_Chr7g0231981 [Rosa chinensis]|uniref:Uncharacterized protein n=1 Tax=Rosa chinensis TaxID=74649 RepID=A0A2P6PFT5_ROSCH|nr:hypothetical protein RchiOBHm_Chr7g0231981 [Rosa chinensis]
MGTISQLELEPGGATTLPTTATSVCPFSFWIQVSQFSQFKAQALQLLAAKATAPQMRCRTSCFLPPIMQLT